MGVSLHSAQTSHSSFSIRLNCRTIGQNGFAAWQAPAAAETVKAVAVSEGRKAFAFAHGRSPSAGAVWRQRRVVDHPQNRATNAASSGRLAAA